MNRRTILTLTIAAAILIAEQWRVPPGSARPVQKPGLALFTEDEAKELRMSEQEWPRIGRTRAVSAGPRIVVENPEVKETSDGPTIEARTPTSLLMLFEQTRAPIDMGSLHIDARKGFFTKSLTGLLKRYVHETTLRVEDLTIPEGRFLVVVQIADTHGVGTVAKYRLRVKPSENQ